MKLRISIRGQRGFTLVEIMIVVAIIGLLASMAIPNLISSRKKAARQACIMNLKAIDGAKANWALDFKKGDNDAPSAADLFGRDKYIENAPSCPGGGSYNIGSVGEKPTCSVPEHTISQ